MAKNNSLVQGKVPWNNNNNNNNKYFVASEIFKPQGLLNLL